MRHPLRNLGHLLVRSLGCVLLSQSTGLSDAASREGCMNQWLFNGVWRPANRVEGNGSLA
jgi:hypothetical protein